MVTYTKDGHINTAGCCEGWELASLWDVQVSSLLTKVLIIAHEQKVLTGYYGQALTL